MAMIRPCISPKIKERLGYLEVRIAMFYTYVLHKGFGDIRSLYDGLNRHYTGSDMNHMFILLQSECGCNVNTYLVSLHRPMFDIIVNQGISLEL